MYAMNFNAPMPPLSITNPYAWLQSLNLNWYFAPSSPANPFNHASGSDVVILTDGLAAPSMRTIVDPSSGGGMWGFPALLMHEARHTNPGGGMMHIGNCGTAGTNDPSLTFGGAWAVEYYYYEWLRNHLPLAFLSPLELEVMGSDPGTFLRGPNGRFCDEWATPVQRNFTPTSPSQAKPLQPPKAHFPKGLGK
jgi:hypothetical protein